MSNEIMWQVIVGDLVHELIDLGKKESEIIEMLKEYGLTEQIIKIWYGLPYEDSKDEVDG